MLSPNSTPVNTIVLGAAGRFPSIIHGLVNPILGANLRSLDRGAHPNSFPCNPVLSPLYHCNPGTIGAKWCKEGGTIPHLWCLIKLKRLPAGAFSAEPVSGPGDPVSG